VTGTSNLALPTPPPVSSGLHAPAPTPGPVTREFVTLGRYQLLSRLAVGGMAEVYLARQGEISGFKTLVVVKRVLPHLAVKPDFIAMFLDEARIASMLDHPNVVRITEVGRAGEEYFLAMELVQGKALASLLQHCEKTKTLLPHNLGALVVANAAAGLHYAHQLTDAAGNLLGLVHRDVSPQNIMISFEGSVKVIDFGIARALGRLGDTSSGSLKGKLGYMAPEQARGEPVDPRADIFSLGVVLWECLAARRLFLRENELATLRAVAYEPIASPSKYAKVDATLEAIVMCALDRNPAERFQTAEEMRIVLEKWIFASGGTSTHDLSALMKSWFPSDCAQWQRAARLALDMQESDPPIDVAFPSLAPSRSGHSRTGTSRPEGSGSGPRSGPQPAILAPGSGMFLPPPLPLPTPRPGPWRRIAILAALAAAVGGGLYLYHRLSQDKLAKGTEPQPASGPIRPTVETLPTAPAPEPAARNEGATDNRAEPAQPQNQEQGSSAESGSRRRHSSSAERRALQREQEEDTTPTGRRINPYEDRNTATKKTKEFRPNPF
jgi:serine/threonine-protein kinase